MPMKRKEHASVKIWNYTVYFMRSSPPNQMFLLAYLHLIHKIQIVHIRRRKSIIFVIKGVFFWHNGLHSSNKPIHIIYQYHFLVFTRWEVTVAPCSIFRVITYQNYIIVSIIDTLYTSKFRIQESSYFPPLEFLQSAASSKGVHPAWTASSTVLGWS